MKDIFNLNEEEKSRIRDLHGVNILSEQMMAQAELKKKDIDAIFEKLFDEAQRLMRLIKDRRSGKSNFKMNDLVSIQKNINKEMKNLRS